jgi:hypothetical protein
MKKERYIILCTDLLSGQQWAYGSIDAMCNHFENPLEISTRRIHQLKKEKGGFPVEADGCRIDRIKVWSNSDVIDDNPPVIE